MREEKTTTEIKYSKESDQLVSRLREDENVSIMGYTKEMKLIKNVGLVRDLDKKIQYKINERDSRNRTFENCDKQ
jgi:hypothetical protein